MPLVPVNEAARTPAADPATGADTAHPPPGKKLPPLPPSLTLSLPSSHSPTRPGGLPAARSATSGALLAEFSEVPVSPLVAASTAGEHYPTHQLSYAHQQRVSGWDKVFAHISQRSEACADDDNDGGDAAAAAVRRSVAGHLRVPGIGEDDSAQGDVQYVYESDGYSIHDVLGFPPTNGTPRTSSAFRGRSDTGASSTGSAMPPYHGSIASTTALSPSSVPPAAGQGHAAQGHAAQGHAVTAPATAPSQENETGHHHLLPSLHSHPHHAGDADGAGPGHLPHGTSALVARLLGHGGDNEIAAADDDENRVPGRKDDLREKLRRAVFKAGVVTRKGPRKLRSAAANGVFPFLQDALFVPMFHFMRDEHGNRAPPVIFDALQLSVSTPWEAMAEEPADGEDEHHFGVRIVLQYGDVKWVLHRRVNDFISLHTVLTLRRFQGRMNQLPAFPQQLGYALEKARRLKPGHHHGQPTDRQQQAVADRSKALEAYLLKLLGALNMRPASDVCAFLELSAVSLMKDVGWKGKEGCLDRRVEHTTGMWCTPHDLRRWSRQWVLVRDSFIAFCNHITDPYPSDVLYADPQFDIKFRKKKGHNPLFPYRITVSNEYRRIQLRSDSERVINEWRASITNMKNSSAWAVPHRFASFAPIRDDSRVIWFVDGDDYFFAVSEALENATDCIYINDWWLSPEVHLRRPPALHEEYRLDRLLKRKAEEGVKIYVTVYKEVTVSLTINSAYTKRKLQSLHPNIIVQRHPDHLAGGTMFWAHHEKIVVVDNTFAFIGGLDMCWGRYDTRGHRLADYFLPYKGTPYTHLQNFFGQDYNNARIHDFANVQDYEETLVDRRTTPRMPWHDVHMAMIGQPARDVARHFIQRWNFVKSSKGLNKPNMPFLMPKGEYSATRNDLQYRGTCRTQVLRSSAEWSMGITKESSIHTAYCEMIRDAKHFVYIENQFFVSNAREDPGYTIKNRVAEALVDRIKRAHRRGEKFHAIVVIPLMPAFEGDVNAVGAATLKLVMHWQYQSICRGDHSIAAQLEKEGIRMHDYIRFFGLRNYDVIRRYADGALKQDLSTVAGNVPAEPAAAAAAAAEEGEAVAVATAAADEHAAGLASKGTSLAPIAHPETPSERGPSAPNGSSRAPTALSFGGVADRSMTERSVAERAAGEYAFQRPDEAFAEDNFPMQANPARHSQELSRRSQERHQAHARRSLNLPRRQTLRPHGSTSGLRALLLGDRDESRTQASRQRAGSPTTDLSSDSDDDGGGRGDGRRGYMQRVDGDGRRKTALRYLVRGTEHIKQYGRHRRNNRAGEGMHKRMYKYGMADERRDSDSEVGSSSSMQVDMEDVENYVHPPQLRRSRDATFLSTPQQGGPPAPRLQPTVLPEFTGAEYLRERARADLAGTASTGHARIVSQPSSIKAAPLPPGHKRAASQAGDKRTTSPAGARGSTLLPGLKRDASPAASTPAYPPPQLARAGPQVLEHELFGGGRRGSAQPKPAPASAARTPAADADIVQVEPEVVDQIMTELVYVHCKLMIVDDRYVVMGSANINDRSMCGNRDSEIAMVIEDTEAVVTSMDGRPYQAARFAHSLRVQLCQEHCGLLEEVDQMRYVFETFAGSPPMDTMRSEAERQEMNRARKIVEDPLSDEFLDLWWSTATCNERIFRDVFRCVPDDTIETFDQYKKFIPGHAVPHGQALPGRSTAEILTSLKAVRGHLVPMPLNFLRSENLGAKLGDKELLVPVEVFT